MQNILIGILIAFIGGYLVYVATEGDLGKPIAGFGASGSQSSGRQVAEAPPVDMSGRCPIYDESGVGKSKTIEMNIGAGEFAFIDTLEFDNLNGRFFITIKGPYRRTHTIKTGGYCAGVVSANYDVIRKTRLQYCGGCSPINLP